MSSPSPAHSGVIPEARRALAAASRIVVFTGAGVSAESDIPTFRDALTGLWARYEPERLATEEGFRADPALVWGWYASRRAAIAAAAPNAAHRAIATLQRDRGARIVTQNVDGLHARAGATDVLELHGSIVRATCLERCGWHDAADALESTDDRVPPHCPACGAYARPDVVWFGEMLPADVWAEAEAACADCDLCLVVGTSGLVHPAAGLPAVARASGARVVVVNPAPSAIDAVAHAVVTGRAADVLPGLLPD